MGDSDISKGRPGRNQAAPGCAQSSNWPSTPRRAHKASDDRARPLTRVQPRGALRNSSAAREPQTHGSGPVTGLEVSSNCSTLVTHCPLNLLGSSSQSCKSCTALASQSRGVSEAFPHERGG